MKISERLNNDIYKTVKYPNFLYQGEWEWKEENLVYKKTGKPLTNFQAFLLEGIHETHKSREGVMRSSSWDSYEDHFMAVIMISDYSGTSFAKRALFAMLKDDLYKNFPDQHPDDKDDSREDWTIFYWPYNGEQIVLRVVDENLEPTSLARWFFIDTNYSNFVNDIDELQDQADKHFLNRFFTENYLRTGKGLDLKIMDYETAIVLENLPKYKGDPTTTLPEVWKAPVNDFSKYYEEVVFDYFKGLVDDSLVWSYKVYLKDGWNSEENMKKLYDFMRENHYIEIHDYSSEISFEANGIPAIWAFKQFDLLDMDKIYTMFQEGDYDSREYIGDECVYLFKIMDELALMPYERKHFIDYIIKEFNTVNPDNVRVSYSERMWLILKAMYENWIGD